MAIPQEDQGEVKDSHPRESQAPFLPFQPAVCQGRRDQEERERKIFIDQRDPLVERIFPDCPQMAQYRSARKPCQLLREWRECVPHAFQNMESVFIRADILSRLDYFSDSELSRMLMIMTLNHEPGTPFQTRKNMPRPISAHSHITLPNLLFHQSHFTFLRKLEIYLIGKEGMERLERDPCLLATALQTFAHIRSDDATSNYERWVQPQKQEAQECARAFLNPHDAITQWIPGSGKDLFHVGQRLALDHILQWSPWTLLEILAAVIVLRPWIHGVVCAGYGGVRDDANPLCFLQPWNAWAFVQV